MLLRVISMVQSFTYVCPLSNILELCGAQSAKNKSFHNVNSNVSFQKIMTRLFKLIHRPFVSLVGSILSTTLHCGVYLLMDERLLLVTW